MRRFFFVRIMLAIACSHIVIGDDFLWDQDYFLPNEQAGVSYKIVEGNKIEISFDERDEMFTIGEFLYKGNVLILQGIDKEYFQIRKEASSKFLLLSQTKLDFEKQEIYSIIARDSADDLKISIKLINVNDNEIILLGGACEINEEQGADFESNCEYTISDDDGFSKYLQFTFDPNERFRMSKEPPECTDKKCFLNLVFKRNEDYEDSTIDNTVLLEWTVYDEKYSDKLKIIVKIKDISDQPPLWNPSVADNYLIKEETSEDIILKAEDGDITIKRSIIYKLSCLGNEICLTKIKLEEDMLRIQPIMLDDPNNNLIQFEVIAVEEEDHSFQTLKQMQLQIVDINNMVPSISISNPEIEHDEESSSPLKTQITIHDKDIGQFGTYTVKLQSDKWVDEVLERIFEIIPNRGYQKVDFSINVRDKSALDYDASGMQDPFTISIIATDDPDNKEGKHNSEDKTITIQLKDFNDEPPEWKVESYEFKIKETIGRKGPEDISVPDLYATDADFNEEHRTITYQLIGIAANNLLGIQKPDGDGRSCTLKTKVQPDGKTQLFDFEKETKVYVAIVASDGLNENSIQLTLDVLDVNDEMPILTAANGKQTTTVTEKKELPLDVDITLIAKDLDKDNLLEYRIDQSRSYFLKQGTKTDWTDENKCIDIDKKSGKLSFTKSPDYKDYDTINLEVMVEDIMAVDPHPQTASLTLFVNIENTPDLDLEFLEEYFDGNSVIEGTQKAKISIIATDPDGPGFEKITYRLNGPDDFMEIDKDTGIISVKENAPISADRTQLNPQGIFDLKYNVIAHCDSGNRSIEKELTIDIIDVNNKPPSASEKDWRFEICEENYDSCNITSKAPFKIDGITDADRDEENRQFSCYIKHGNDFYSTRVIEWDGCWIDVNDGKSIEILNGIDQHTFDVVFKDIGNPNLSDEVSVIMKIIDINNKKPRVKANLEFLVDETYKKGDVLGMIEGIDEDVDEHNAKIKYTLIDVKKQDGNKKLSIDDFEEPELNAGSIRNAKLHLKRENLATYYGTYLLTLVASNPNGWPLIEPTNDNIVKLTVAKVNFHSVKFTNITNPLILSTEQRINHVLVEHGGDGKNVENIRAVADDADEGKYAIDFTFVDNEGKEIQHEVFNIINADKQEAQLQLKTSENLGSSYAIRIQAQSRDAKPPQPPATANINIYFLSKDASPKFTENTHTCNWDEDKKPGPLNCKTLPLAQGFGTFRSDYNISYFIAHSFPDGAYVINDPMKNEVDVTQAIDLALLDETPSTFTVEARFGNHKPSENLSEDSFLLVTVDVEDTNNHVPVFPKDRLDGVLLTGKVDKTLNITIKADDPDKNDKHTHEVDWDTYTTKGTDLPEKDEHLFVFVESNNDPHESKPKANFEVKKSMSGVIEFDVLVTNLPICYKCDRVHLEVYVINDANLYGIVFQNLEEQVNQKKETIEEILSKLLEYKSRIYDVRAFQEETRKTEVIAYFIDTNEKVAVSSKIIKAQIHNIEFLNQLAVEFANEGLFLSQAIGGDEEVESYEEAYKLALIVVSVVMGLLIIALVAFFTYKLRATTSRLQRLNQAEARRPTMIPNLPGANRRPTQGINLNISSLGNDVGAGDDLSFSGSSSNSKKRPSLTTIDDDDDENYIGVENNDIFKNAPKC